MESSILEKNAKEKGKKLLYIENFQLKKNYNALFYSVLCSIINIYNEVPKEESEKKGIYFLESENLLLANITKDLVESYYEYEKLFQNLMGGKNTLFQKFSPEFDKMSNFSDRNKKKYKFDIALSNSSNNTSNNNEVNNDDNKTTTSVLEQINKSYVPSKLNGQKKSRIQNNLDEFSNYFNGIYFESVAIESLFRLIDENFTDEEDAKNSIVFLPRIIFYLEKKMKYQPYNADKKKYSGFNEIDCAFILKGKEKVIFKMEMITCFKSFNTKKESEFFNIKNFSELTLCKDDVVLIEVKSRWNRLTKNEEDIYIDKDDTENKLEKFIYRAKKFIPFYLKLKLIQKTQKVVLIYLYNNSMYFDIEKEKDEINKARRLLKYEKNMELYIAYYQPYVKMFNSYQNIKHLRNLNQEVSNQKSRLETQEEEIKNQKMEIKNQKMEIKKLEQEVKEMKELFKKKEDDWNIQNKKIIDEMMQSLLNKMNLPHPDMNNNLENNENNVIDKDNNDKKKKNSISSSSNTTTNESFNKK